MEDLKPLVINVLNSCNPEHSYGFGVILLNLGIIWFLVLTLARLDVTDKEIRETVIERYTKMRMERYIPMSYIGELALILSYSKDPPK